MMNVLGSPRRSWPGQGALRVLGPVRSILGWNVHMHHSHVDVHLPVVVRGGWPRFGWHEDGSRQNR